MSEYKTYYLDDPNLPLHIKALVESAKFQEDLRRGLADLDAGRTVSLEELLAKYGP